MRKTALVFMLLGAGALTACTTTDPYTGMPVRNNTGTGALAGAGAGALLGYLTNTNKGEQGRKNALLMLASKTGELRFVTVRMD